MAEEFDLSTGAILAIYNGDSADMNPLVSEPIVQVLSIKKVVSSGQGVDRYRMIVSDGEHFIQAMLATQLNHLVQSDNPTITKNTVIKLSTYACNVVQGKRIIICLSFDALSSPAEKIGTPSTVDSVANAANAGGDVAMKDAPAVAASAPKAAAQKKGPAGKRGGGGGMPITPVEGLSPYNNKWTIKGRVTTKSDIRHWSNAKGDGKLFSVNFLDETGEIRATGFGDQVDSFYELLQEGKVYLVSKARVNIAKKQFSNLSNEYEITFGNETEVTLCEDQDSVPQIKYDFVDLAALIDLEKDATCDVLGIVKETGDVSEITAKASQKQIKKRELTIVDRSGYSCRLTLWGKSAETWNGEEGAVYAFKGAKVGDFGGRTLSMGGQSTVTADPDIPEAHSLRGWFDTEGTNQAFQSHSNSSGGGGTGTFKAEEFKTLDCIELEDLGNGEKADFFNARATITLIRPENLSYPACPNEKCNKKVVMVSDDEWRCEKCDQSHTAPEFRYIMGVCISDHTSQAWVSAFNDVGVEILGMSANELNKIKEEDESAFGAILQGAVGNMYNFSLRSKAESYSEKVTVKSIINKLGKVDYKKASEELLEKIKLF